MEYAIWNLCHFSKHILTNAYHGISVKAFFFNWDHILFIWWVWTGEIVQLQENFPIWCIATLWTLYQSPHALQLPASCMNQNVWPRTIIEPGTAHWSWLNRTGSYEIAVGKKAAMAQNSHGQFINCQQPAAVIGKLAWLAKFSAFMNENRDQDMNGKSASERSASDRIDSLLLPFFSCLHPCFIQNPEYSLRTFSCSAGIHGFWMQKRRQTIRGRGNRLYKWSMNEGPGRVYCQVSLGVQLNAILSLSHHQSCEVSSLKR